MSPSVSPTPITAGQIGKIQELIGAGLRKSRLQSQPVQELLETRADLLVDTIVEFIQRRAEEISSMLVHHVENVDRGVSAYDLLKLTQRKLHVEHPLANSLPRDGRESDDVFFFRIPRGTRNIDLEQVFAKRGLKPADPYALAQVNLDDEAFSGRYPNATYWRDEMGRFVGLAFYEKDGARSIIVDSSDGVWHDQWWLAGVRP
jgi:hypothetical protein